MPRPRVLAALLAAVALLVTACGGNATDSSGSGGAGSPAERVRLGFFANLTHATPLVGTGRGFYAKALGDTELETQVFNAGPAAVESLFAGAIDATYIGPNPAINAFVKSKGEAVRIIAGATSGGASLVVRPDITTPEDLKGTTLATPQLGNTQDVALRHWLGEQGFATSTTGIGDVTIAPSENATTLQLFRDGKVDGAWVPEPWASRLVLEGGCRVLVDERTLWPGGRFVTTHLLVSTKFLDEHPQTVEALLRGHVETTAWIRANAEQAKATVNDRLGDVGGKPLTADVLDRAWRSIEVTDDPVASSLQTSADHAVDVGILKSAELKGIYDLRRLNAVLADAGGPAVADAGLGVQ